MLEFNPVYDPVQLEVAGSPARARPSPRSDTLSRAGLRIDVHTDLAAIETEWRGFEERADCTPFQTFAWLSAWQRHIGSRRGTRPAIVVGRDAVGEILFLFPLAVEGDSLRRLTWLGSDLCDYNAPLLAEDFSRAVPVGCFPQLWRQILRSLRGDAKLRFDLVDLSKMPEQVGGQPNPFRQLPLTANPSGAHVADLGDDWDEFYAMKRSSTVRKQERKQLRRLADFGELRFVQAQGPEAVELTLGTLFAQKARSFARMGVEDLFTRPGHCEFFQDLGGDPSARGMVQVTRLDLGSTIAAVNLGLQFRSRFYLILSSYDDGEVSKYGPGRAHLRETIRHAIEQGCRQFDFTIGDEPYKRDWANVELRLHDHVAAITLRGRAATARIRAFRRAKRFIKRNPALWRAFTYWRARAAS